MEQIANRRKLAAILSADAAGYSRMMGENDQETVRALNACRDIFKRAIAQFSGRVVDTAGDNVLAEFASVVEAVRCAVEVQQEIQAHNTDLPETRRMQFRIGLNLGDLIEEPDGSIYGDGVNVAARVQALAEPGAVCISGTVHDHIESKLPYAYDSLGEHAVKNIAKPVRVYRVRTDATAKPAAPVTNKAVSKRRLAAVASVAAGLAIVLAGSWYAMQRRATEDAMLALPKGPSIAVLPFANMSGDPKDESLADGLTEDIITELSRFPDLFVIARNSTFKYKGKSVDVRDVGKDLGVIYVLEGSIRSVGERIRASAQLIDARTGAHVWGEAFDRERTSADVFDLQDDLTKHVVAQIASGYGVLTKLGSERARRGAAADLDSYACVLQARAYYRVFEASAHLDARTCLEAVVKKDPNYAEAWAWLALMYLDEFRYKYNLLPERPRPLDTALEIAKHAVSVDPHSQYAHNALAKIHYFRHETELFFAHAQRALALNPNNVQTLADIGFSTAFAGQWERGLAMLRKVMALDPGYPSHLHFPFFYDHYRKREYAQAVAEALRVNTPGLFWNYVVLSAGYGQLGRKEEAKQAIAALLKMYPEYPQHAREEYRKYNFEPVLIEHVMEGLRKAGLEIPQE